MTPAGALELARAVKRALAEETPPMRYFTFRFLHSRRYVEREYTLAGTQERDCLAAAWTLLRAAELSTGYVREDWRVLSTVIRPVVDLADALGV